MRHLRREIAAQRARISDDRLLISAHAALGRERLREVLASPWTLGASFGLGLALGLHRRAERVEAPESPPADRGEPSALVRWALRDLAVPAVLGWLGQRQANQEAGLDPDAYPP